MPEHFNVPAFFHWIVFEETGDWRLRGAPAKLKPLHGKRSERLG